MKKIEIFTDGACSGNPGPGGYGVILRYKGTSKELWGVELYSDSKYIIDAVTKGWAKKWRANNWVKSDKKKALNSDLWEKLLDLLEVHKVNFNWVKGHAGHPENERCDELAVMGSKQFLLS